MLVKKLVQLAAERKTSKQRIQRLESAIASSVASPGVSAEEELHSKLVKIVGSFISLSPYSLPV